MNAMMGTPDRVPRTTFPLCPATDAPGEPRSSAAELWRTGWIDSPTFERPEPRMSETRGGGAGLAEERAGCCMGPAEGRFTGGGHDPSEVRSTFCIAPRTIHARPRARADPRPVRRWVRSAGFPHLMQIASVLVIYSATASNCGIGSKGFPRSPGRVRR